MTWAERLLRLTVGDPKREIAEHLRHVHQRAVEQAQRLAAAAGPEC